MIPENWRLFCRQSRIINNRAGNWRAAINGAEKNQSGILVVLQPAKAAPINIHNPNDQPLFVIASGPLKTTAPVSDAGLTRHFYRPDGAEHAANDLKQGETYLVTLEGSAQSANDAQLFVHDTTEMELRPLSCALDANAGLPESWGWLKNLALTPVAACETGSRTIDAVLNLPDTNGKNSWRTAYLVKAVFAGTFNLPFGAPRVCR